MLLVFLFGCILILLILFNIKIGSEIKNKKILIIGGTSGIGMELAKKLYKNGNKITVSSRNLNRAEDAINKIMNRANSTNSTNNSHNYTNTNSTINSLNSLNAIQFDSTADQIFRNDSYDLIFYCPGVSFPGYFCDPNFADFENKLKIQMDLNFYGMLKSLHFFKKGCSKPFEFVVFSSTLALFPIPGYTGYSPTKTCLRSFFETEKEKLKEEGISLKIFYSCSVQTPSFSKEELIKPVFTKKIEHTNTVAKPQDVAEYLCWVLGTRSAIAYDWFTYFAMIKNECENIIDYLFYPLAVLTIFFSKIYIKREFNHRVK